MNGTEAKTGMPSEPKCPQCDATVPAGSPEGLCPACLLRPGANDSATQPRVAPFEPPQVETLAKLFPQLEILSLIGKGGMGAVYKARQPSLDRFVAVKILPPQAVGGPSSERFNREAKTLARLSHPNIVTVHEFGQAGELPFFIMEFVDGVNLRQMQRQNRLAPREALAIVSQLCDALQYAHDQGVVHRDIKPENVLVDRQGRIKIADFGLAKLMGGNAEMAHLTVAGQTMGTPHYMAPEQVEHPTEVDHRADIFSLGVVFYELLTGELPLGKFPLPSRKVQIDVRLDDVVLRTLEKEPELRYQSAGEVRSRMDTIARTAGDPPVIGEPAKSTTPARPLGRMAIAIAGLVCCIPVSVLAGWAAQSQGVALSLFVTFILASLILGIISFRDILGKIVVGLCLMFALGVGLVILIQVERSAQTKQAFERAEIQKKEAELKLLDQMASEIKKKVDVGVVPPMDYEIARARRDAASARLHNRTVDAARIEYEIADLVLGATRAKFKVGIATQEECLKAENQKELARIEYQKEFAKSGK